MVRELPWVATVAVLVAAFAGTASAEGFGRRREPPAATEDLVELGRRLFFDPALSRSGTRSCASCHDPDHAFADRAALSRDEAGLTLRTSQTLVDCASASRFHWDGEFESIESLVLARIQPDGSSYYGRASLRRPMDLDLALRRYDGALHATFGSETATAPGVAQAVAAYVRTIEGAPSAYDRFRTGEEDALSPAARRGLALFEGRAHCDQCHRTRGERAPFTDGAFHDTGVAWRSDGRPPSEALRAGEPTLRARLRRETPDDVTTDVGRMLRTRRPEDNRRFKTPSLRDVARRGPYMHDGSFATLEQVVRHYAEGCSPDPDLDPALAPFAASDEDVADLVAFLGALTGEERAGRARVVWRARAFRTTLRFVDGAGEPVAGLEVRVRPAGDSLPSDDGRRLLDGTFLTDRDGRMRYVVPPATHVEVTALGGTWEIVGSPWIPDTCEQAVMLVVDRLAPAPSRGAGRRRSPPSSGPPPSGLSRP
jgi:cytochrome c peroxidase